MFGLKFKTPGLEMCLTPVHPQTHTPRFKVKQPLVCTAMGTNLGMVAVPSVGCDTVVAAIACDSTGLAAVDMVVGAGIAVAAVGRVADVVGMIVEVDTVAAAIVVGAGCGCMVAVAENIHHEKQSIV